MNSNIKRLHYTVLACLVLMSGFSQNSVSYNSSIFNSNLEVVDAQISAETISLVIYEIDKSDPKYLTDNCSECPDGKSIVMDIDFTRGFKFPITEEDSVYVRLTLLKKNLNENAHNQAQVNQMNNSRNHSEEAQLKNDAESIKLKGQEIATLMQEGKITPAEAEKQLMALTQPYLDDLDNSTTANIEGEEFMKKANFAIWYYNDKLLTTSESFSGYLYIKEFNEQRFVAEFRGVDVERCVEKRIASSKEAAAKCSAVISQYLPETKLYREGAASLSIDVAISEFLNNR